MGEDLARTDPQQIRSHSALRRQWYYSIELAPDLYTPGMDHQNVAITRELLRHINVEAGGTNEGPARCLDIGTQEGLIPLLLDRRGARVVAYDRTLQMAGFNLISQALGAEFELFGGKLQDLPQTLHEAGHSAFDVVVFSGVMYHMFDPLGGLAVSRGLVRNGGIFVFESFAAFDESVSMHFNSANRFSDHAWWLPSVPCVDYLLRFLRLEVLDVVYLGPWERENTPPHGRVAIACRAVETARPESGDPRVTGAVTGADLNYSEFLDWRDVASDEPPVGYEGVARKLVRRPSGSVDVLATVNATDPFPVEPDQVRLDLDAKY